MKDYYDRILNMTLNTDENEILDLCNFVTTNSLYEDEFYQNLYALVEKEKYLAKKYNYKLSLYPKLSNQVKERLENIFVDKYSNGISEDCAVLLDTCHKYGYVNVLDPRYSIYFDTCHFQNKQQFDLDEGKCDVFYRDFSHKNVIVRVSNREDIHIAPREARKDIKRNVFRNVGRVNDKDSDYYFIGLNYIDVIGLTSYWNFAIDRETGKRIGLPYKVGFAPYYMLGYFIRCKGMGDIVEFYDHRFRKKMSVNHVSKFAVDYKLERFIIADDVNLVHIYDKNLELKDIVDLGMLYHNARVCKVNDGVMSLYLYDSYKVVYYDYINHREIDSFKYMGSHCNRFVYNEGLYPFVDDNEKSGYKNIEGDTLIEPKFSSTYPFIGNIAPVYTTTKSLIINRCGETMALEELCARLYYARKQAIMRMYPSEPYLTVYYDYLIKYPKSLRLEADYKKGKYMLYSNFEAELLGKNKGYIDTFDHYLIDEDMPIKDINFSNSRKLSLKKVK